MSIRLVLYMPLAPSIPIATMIARGSAIVGPETDNFSDLITICYEEAEDGRSTITIYADRVRRAAERHLSTSPTGAQCSVSRGDLIRVGWFDEENGITLNEATMIALAAWFEVREITPQLVTDFLS